MSLVTDVEFRKSNKGKWAWLWTAYLGKACIGMVQIKSGNAGFICSYGRMMAQKKEVPDLPSARQFLFANWTAQEVE